MGQKKTIVRKNEKNTRFWVLESDDGCVIANGSKKVATDHGQRNEYCRDVIVESQMSIGCDVIYIRFFLHTIEY